MSKQEKSLYNPGYKEFTYFYGGFFSNWHPQPFEVNGVTYNCGEQYMMHQKALLFKDSATAKKILSSRYPGDQKKLGRLVKGFDEEVWNAKCVKLMIKGLTEKFSHGSYLYAALMKTKNTLLVECSPYDKIWGIGLSIDDAKAGKPWDGLNRLGEVLTKIRESYEKSIKDDYAKEMPANFT